MAEHSVGNGTVSEEILVLFQGLSESIEEHGDLGEFVGEDYDGVSLIPEYYDDDGNRAMKCRIVVGVLAETELDDDVIENLSDYVNDFCHNRGDLDQEMRNRGVDPDILGWWPVEFEIGS